GRSWVGRGRRDQSWGSSSSERYNKGQGAKKVEDDRLWLRRHSHQHLAEVLTLEQTEKRCGRLFQPVDDVFAVFEAACAHPFADIAQKIGLFRGKIRDDEAAQE